MATSVSKESYGERCRQVRCVCGSGVAVKEDAAVATREVAAVLLQRGHVAVRRERTRGGTASGGSEAVKEDAAASCRDELTASVRRAFYTP